MYGPPRVCKVIHSAWQLSLRKCIRPSCGDLFSWPQWDPRTTRLIISAACNSRLCVKVQGNAVRLFCHFVLVTLQNSDWKISCLRLRCYSAIRL